ncbi:Ferredoxin subunit of nitrite reductase or a ring-hydroxylating dioxygenase [Sinomicrobium oceani]|uniref:Ferredoxin subunit of nitrite reductase or a ring-hydroxylating dioxygenase n=1 Tax=Sinomicrobium oceani TaxID=1150368 RepID=A0A1K1MYB8_9FLAO|nr:Rieske (2Fe-2S) protein [Sinomicrobium oceani]SFW27006.1 Ferredoxin subunit of nitrite reductase or a ring-hydroxylating dioxygenase [Sinomicrobium oceani]
MHRKEFLKTCGYGCLGLLGAASLLESCAGTKYLHVPLEGEFLNLPLDAFVFIKKEKKEFRKYVVVYNDWLQYPVCVYRFSDTEYQALLMKCTHQGTELQVFGDRIQCPAHGSEFTNTGAVQNGPADAPLRTFPVQVEETVLKINLK